MRFAQVLKEYSENKKRRGLKESISATELHKLREAYENGEFDEKKGQSLKERKEKVLEKIKERRQSQKETKSPLKERAEKIRLRKRLEELRQKRLEARKLQECGGRKCTCKDGECDCETTSRKTVRRPSRLARRTQDTDREELEERLEKIHKRNRIKEAIRRKKSLRESVRNRMMYHRRKARMKEEGEVVDAVSGEGMDQTTDPNAQATDTTPMNPADIASTIEQIKTEIDNLAAQLGVQAEPMDTNADANIPPEGDVNMDTMPSTEGGVDQTQPVMTESQKRAIRRSFRKIKEALKNKKVARVFESKYPLSYSSIINLIDGPVLPGQSVVACDTVINQIDKTPYKVNTENDKSMLDKVVSLKQLINGTEKNVVRWGQDPKGKIDYKFAESATEKMVSDKIKENQDRWNFAQILKSGVLK
jgi:hypothetical protein